MSEYRDNYYNGAREEYTALRVVGFLFIFVWLVPLGFFISLTSTDDCLPMAGGAGGGSSNVGAQAAGQYGYDGSYYPNTNTAGAGGGKKKKGIFKGFIDGILERKQQMFPGVDKRSY